MAYNHEVAIDVEHLEATNSKEKPSMKLKRRASSSKVWPVLLSWWTSIFTMSSVLSVSVDPLFLYIPITNEDIKCIRLDQNLKTVTLLLRSAMDLPCLVHIISQIILAATRPRQLWRVSLVDHALKMAKTIKWPYFLVDVLAILPIPQVVILILLTRTTASKSLNERKFLNSLILFQYLPRIFRMYLNSCKVNKEEGKNGHRSDRTLLRLYKFILASHLCFPINFFLLQRV